MQCRFERPYLRFSLGVPSRCRIVSRGRYHGVLMAGFVIFARRKMCSQSSFLAGVGAAIPRAEFRSSSDGGAIDRECSTGSEQLAISENRTFDLGTVPPS